MKKEWPCRKKAGKKLGELISSRINRTVFLANRAKKFILRNHFTQGSQSNINVVIKHATFPNFDFSSFQVEPAIMKPGSSAAAAAATAAATATATSVIIPVQGSESDKKKLNEEKKEAEICRSSSSYGDKENIKSGKTKKNMQKNISL